MDTKRIVEEECILKEDGTALIKAIDALADGVYDYDFESKKTTVSTNFYHMLGYEPNEFEVTDEKWDTLVHPEDRGIVNKLFDDHIDQITSRYQAEYRMQCKDGSYRWMCCSGKIIESEGNRAIRMIGSLSDIHEKKQSALGMANLLKATNTLQGTAFFQQMCKSLHELLSVDFVVITSLAGKEEGKILKVLTMWEKDHFKEPFEYDIAGTPCELIYTNKQILFIGDKLFQKFPDDLYLKEHNITCYYGIPFCDTGGHLIGHLFIMNEKAKSIKPWMKSITELYAQTIGSEVERLKNEQRLKQLNESLEEAVVQRTGQLEEAIHELDSFFYKASHDIRSPITTIEGIYNLLHTANDEEERSLLMRMLGEQIHIIEKLNKSINEVGSIRKHELDIEYIPLAYFIGEHLDSLDLTSQCICQMDVSDNLKIKSDKYLLGIIINNFLRNCIDYRDHKKSRHCINIRYSDSTVGKMLIIEDNGIGIPHDFKESQFKMFFRANATYSGIGLGLYKSELAANKINVELDLTGKEGEGSKAIIHFRF